MTSSCRDPFGSPRPPGVRFADGEFTKITFDKSANKQDQTNCGFRIMFMDRSFLHRKNFDLSTISEITVHYNHGKTTAT